MRIGDIVESGSEYGIVVHVNSDESFDAQYASGRTEHLPEELTAARRIELTTEQRAIVSAAIAAEALRRIG